MTNLNLAGLDVVSGPEVALRLRPKTHGRSRAGRLLVGSIPLIGSVRAELQALPAETSVEELVATPATRLVKTRDPPSRRLRRQWATTAERVAEEHKR